MNCQETRKWMSPYLDSELGATKTFEVGAHLSECPRCKSRFESEGKVDELIRSHLQQEEMPPDLWEGICRSVSEPLWIRRLRSPRTIALAACLALAVIGAVLMQSGSSTVQTPALVQSLLVSAPDNDPFVDTGMDQADILRLLEDRFGGRFSLAAMNESFGSHRLDFIEAVDRTDADGRAYVELRLNCCGRPVLMVLAENGAGGLPTPFAGAPHNGSTASASFDDVHIATRDYGGVVAVVASRHPVEQIAGSLRFSKA